MKSSLLLLVALLGFFVVRPLRADPPTVVDLNKSKNRNQEALINDVVRNDEPTIRYEISINGENFTVESDRITKLRSTDKPGTTYEVGIRVAPYQPWKLNKAQFEYHAGFTVSDDRQPASRTATFKHDLGFVMIVTDLGGPLPPENQDKTLQLLSDSMQKTFKAGGAARVEVGKPAVRTAGKTTMRGVTIHYDDKDAVGHTSLVYLVTGEGFACSCIVQCLDVDRENVLPIVTPTLESFGPRGKS